MSLLLEIWFFPLVVALAAITVPIIAMLKKHATPAQVPSDMSTWSGWLDRTGVAVGILIVVGFALWRLLRWVKPRADVVLDGFIANANRVQPLLDAQQARDAAQSARDTAILSAIKSLEGAITAHTMVVEQLAERVNAQSHRTALIAEHVAKMADHLLALSIKIDA